MTQRIELLMLNAEELFLNDEPEFESYAVIAYSAFVRLAQLTPAIVRVRFRDHNGRIVEEFSRAYSRR